jgi:hypothetical protein
MVKERKRVKYVEAEIDEWDLIDAALAGGMIILATKEDEKRYLVINAGGDPIASIYSHIAEKEVPRPLMYDVLGDFFKATEKRDKEKSIKHTATKIEKFEDGIFYAITEFYFDGELWKHDSRPSDGIALALKTGADIYINEDVMRAAGLTEEEMDKTKRGVEEFVENLKKGFISCQGCPGCSKEKSPQEKDIEPKKDADVMFG